MSKDFNDIIGDKSLFGHKKNFNEIYKLLNSRFFNNPLLISGKKGIGKFTLIHHIIASLLDKNNYDFKFNIIKKDNSYYDIKTNNYDQNLIYLSGEDKGVNIEKIRKIRLDLIKSTINNRQRYIILDDVDLFNINCLNALLKIIEEPSKINQFILIDNNNKDLLDTIKSRCIQFKIFLRNSEIIDIISDLVTINKIDAIINYRDITLTPGNYLLFNEICIDKKIDLNHDILENIKKLVLFFKQTKELKYLNLLLFIIDKYYYTASKKIGDFDNLNLKRSLMIKKINDLNNLNLNNQNIINDIEKNL